MTLAHRIAAAISQATDEDGFLFADMLSVENAAGVAVEHMKEMGR